MKVKIQCHDLESAENLVVAINTYTDLNTIIILDSSGKFKENNYYIEIQEV